MFYQGFHQGVRMVYAREAVRKQEQTRSLSAIRPTRLYTNLAECKWNTASGVSGRVLHGNGVELGPAAEASRERARKVWESSIGLEWA